MVDKKIRVTITGRDKVTTLVKTGVISRICCLAGACHYPSALERHTHTHTQCKFITKFVYEVVTKFLVNSS